MKPPARLLTDETIEAELRTALEGEARREIEFDVDAGLERLQAAIGAGAPAPADITAVSSLKAKLLLGGGGAVVAAAAVIGWSLSRPEAQSPAPAVQHAPPVVLAISARPAASTPMPSATPVIVAPPPPKASVSTPLVPSPSASTPRERLAEEVRHLAEARKLAASNPGAAAGMADEGHARFKAGVLYQEREALAISSLARAGRGSEARTRGERFVARFPKSPYAEQVRAATGIVP